MCFPFAESRIKLVLRLYSGEPNAELHKVILALARLTPLIPRALPKPLICKLSKRLGLSPPRKGRAAWSPQTPLSSLLDTNMTRQVPPQIQKSQLSRAVLLVPTLHPRKPWR